MPKKKGIINEALQSDPVVAAKGFVGKAMEVFNDPPLAPETALTKRARRPAVRQPMAKAAKTAKPMDRKLVSTMEDYEVKYLAQKHSVTQKAVKEAVAKVGHSRNKVEAELKKKS